MKQNKAVALKYRHGLDSAPRVIAKGRSLVADRIIDLAHEHGIPIREDRNLVEAISTLDLYEDIPPELYKAVAEILVFIYQCSAKKEQGSAS
ncbi:MAG: EscU/YscU/HrcU family type III secretion system export apparatus switch protein [Nitrospirota bacterium]